MSNDNRIAKSEFPYKAVADEINNFLYPPLRPIDPSQGTVAMDALLPLDQSMPDARDYAVYVSIPYCRVRCHSCHCFRGFLPQRKGREEAIQQYVDAVEKQARAYGRSARFSSARCGAVYIGGGTGSVLTETQLNQLMTAFREAFTLRPDVELNLEGNPDDYTQDYVKAARASGVTRLSIGYQSKDESTLRALNSPHNVEQGMAAVQNALQAGFETVNVDLLYNVPGQTEQMWIDEVESLIALGPQGISINDYVVFPGSNSERLILAGRLPPAHGLNTVDHWYRLASQRLTSRGYIEQVRGIHALVGHAQKYVDLGCPKGCDIVGLGAGAFSFVDRYQYRNVFDAGAYTAGVEQGRCFDADCVSREGTRRDLMERFIIHNFFAAKLDRRSFQARFKQDPLEAFPEVFAMLEEHALVDVDADSISLNALGKKWRRNIYHEFHRADVVAVDSRPSVQSKPTRPLVRWDGRTSLGRIARD